MVGLCEAEVDVDVGVSVEELREELELQEGILWVDGVLRALGRDDGRDLVFRRGFLGRRQRVRLLWLV